MPGIQRRMAVRGRKRTEHFRACKVGEGGGRKVEKGKTGLQVQGTTEKVTAWKD